MDETSETASCGCAAQETAGRHPVAVDPEIKRTVLNRLRRIEGQVRGLQRMVEEERYCAEVITQISSVQEALRSTARSVLQNHLRHCATAAFQSGDSGRAEAMYTELLDLMSKAR
ncbi:MAG TPA: metal-sensitive transcriptional regulator [Gemmatimonadales bacterium]|jgi:DNA-binding FrmR family transcriptional regulator